MDVFTAPRVGDYPGQCVLKSLEFVSVGLWRAIEDGVGLVKPRVNHCTSNSLRHVSSQRRADMLQNLDMVVSWVTDVLYVLDEGEVTV